MSSTTDKIPTKTKEKKTQQSEPQSILTDSNKQAKQANTNQTAKDPTKKIVKPQEKGILNKF